MKRRTYDATSRRLAAQATCHSILLAARKLFVQDGYVGTTMPAIAQAAGVSLDTVYASVGRKPTLFKRLVEASISGKDEAQLAEERDYVLAIRAEPKAHKKLQVYAEALTRIHARLAPLFKVLQAASSVNPDLSDLWQEIAQRRAFNMRLFAADLAATGELRGGLSQDQAADIIWTMNSPEFYVLLVEQCGWSPQVFESWLADAWRRLLLASAACPGNATHA